MKRKGVFSMKPVGVWTAFLSLAGLVNAQPLVTNWVAYNDHQRGANTSPQATAYSVTATLTPVGGPLEDINTGITTPVGVTIHSDGDLPGYAGASSAPNSGTPAAQIFGDVNLAQIDWTGSSIQLGGAAPWTADYTLTFTNLNPSAKYVLYATGVRGGGYAGRWNLATISNALSFVPAHIAGPGSPGIITNGWDPYGTNLTAAQAAFNVGDNLCGDVIGWTDIIPNGKSFSVICTNYRFLGGTNTAVPVPGAPGATNQDTYAYAFSAVMLAEMVPPVAPVITVQPADTTVLQLNPVALSASGTGAPYVHYQWFLAPTNNPTPLPGQTGPTYAIANATVANTGGYFVVVSNAIGSITSRVAQLTVNRDTNGPAFMSCIATPDFVNDPTGSTYKYTVTFSKAVDMNTAANNNIGVYSFQTPDGGNNYMPLTAVSSSPTNVILTSPDPFLVLGYGYINFRLVAAAGGGAGVEQIVDLDGNLLPVNSFVPVFWNIPLIPAPLYDTATWDYYENKSATSSPLSGQNWQTNGETVLPNFWKQGRQMFSGSLTATVEKGDTTEFGASSIHTTLTAPSSANVLITYYRRQFYMPAADPSAVTLKMRHVIDDGAAMYLNTVSIATTFNRIRLPAGFIWSTPGIMAPRNTSGVHPTETTNNPAVLSTANLRLGANNFFAIENHQTSAIATNTGVVTGVELMAYITNFASGPARVVSQPPAYLTLNEGQPLSLTVGVDGLLPLSFQWYKNGSPITGATNLTYAVAAATPANTANYTFVVTNSSSAGTSIVAHVTINADLVPPQALSALGSRWGADGGSNVYVAFSKIMDPNSIQTFHFTLSGGGSNLTIRSATLVSNTIAVLNTSKRLPGVDYTIGVNGVTDASYSKNPCVASLPVIAQYDVVQMTDTNQVWSYDDAGVDHGASWFQTNFIGPWKTGRAVFDSIFSGTNRATVGGQPVHTQLNLFYPQPWGVTSNTITFYFQTLFQWPGTTNRTTFYLNNLVDDGAAFYLNGVEFYNTNMPSVRQPDTTQAPLAVGTPVVTPPTNQLGTAVVVTNLVAGANLLAVEVRQAGFTSPDITFGTTIMAAVPTWGASTTVVHPKLLVELLGTGQVRVSWSPNDGILMQSTSVATGWTPVPGSPNPYVTTPSGQVFYKLSK